MTQYQCGNCRELSLLGPSARFCPYCGSSSLILVIKEEAEQPRPGPGVADVEDLQEEVARTRRRSKQ
jgi:hypothetical protein